MSDPGAFSEDAIQRYIDGQLTANDVAAIEDWLAKHPERKGEVSADRELMKALRAMAEPVLNETVPQRHVAAIEPLLLRERGLPPEAPGDVVHGPDAEAGRQA